MKHLIGFLFISLLVYACAGDTSESQTTTPKPTTAKVDDGKGVGEIKSVTMNDPLDQGMIAKGKAIYEMKCAACHKLTDQRVVGPGWAGVTEKRKPEWIMNMVTNVEVMLASDPAAQKLLEECLTRMPNQNISIGDARDLLEFMYDNDKAVN
jgi:mono/diheme cytochrome c family protein